MLKLMEIILEALGLEMKDFVAMVGNKNSDCYFSKDYGVDVKFESGFKFKLEFHSTFFCNEGAFDLIRALYLKISEHIEIQLSINEIHVAQDYTGLKTTDFFKEGFSSPSYVKCFNILYDPLVKVKSQIPSTTFYLRDPSAKGSKWTMCFYDKTKELIEKKSTVSAIKNEYYKKLGYFDSEVTRVELKINSQLSRVHFDGLFSSETEEDFCKKILSTFYKKRRIYHLKSNEIFDKNNSDRFKKYKLWDQIFLNECEPVTNKSKDDLLFFEMLNKEQFRNRLANLLSKTNVKLSTDELEEEIVKANEIRIERISRKETTVRRQRLVLSKFKRNNNELFGKDKNGKHFGNLSLNSFFTLNDK
jgi:hypothetical protein